MMKPFSTGLLLTAMLLNAAGTAAQDDRYLPASCAQQKVEHEHYILCWSEEHEQAQWVAYELTPAEVRGHVDRTDNFRQDPGIATGSASLADYRGSGYDRGHLAPAGDMAFSHQAMSESFYLSNISPQRASFNRGIWRQLESQVRAWAQDEGPLYIITGGILAGSYRDIGPNDVTVPRAYYKIIMDQSEPLNALAFIMVNEKGNGSLRSYATPIDEVEEQTGHDFFHSLPEAKEKRLENGVNLKPWDFDASVKHYSDEAGDKEYHTDRDNKININEASAAKLDRLYGIGPAKAGNIIEARPYQSVEDLTRAKGIGEVSLSRIEDYITVGLPGIHYENEGTGSSGGININEASRHKLKSLPGIGEVLSGRIIEARPFNDIREIEEVKGIGPKTFEKIRYKISAY